MKKRTKKIILNACKGLELALKKVLIGIDSYPYALRYADATYAKHKEGEVSIILHRKFKKRLSPKLLEFLIWHELAHIMIKRKRENLYISSGRLCNKLYP